MSKRATASSKAATQGHPSQSAISIHHVSSTREQCRCRSMRAGLGEGAQAALPYPMSRFRRESQWEQSAAS